MVYIELGLSDLDQGLRAESGFKFEVQGLGLAWVAGLVKPIMGQKEEAE